MKAALIIQPEAELDLQEATDWYFAEAPDFEGLFLQSVGSIFDRIVTAPNQFPIVWRAVRQAVLPDLLYSVFFVVAEDSEMVFVLAVLHHARNPRVWKSRA